MHTFRVWAPHASRVDLELYPGGVRAMTAGERGHFHCQVDEAGPGTRYAFRLDGGPPRPDPRSGFQPEGPHGPSELVDHANFAWSDGGWHGRPLAGAVIYELHVGTFTAEGTFDAAIEKLPHLVSLGIDLVELMPVVEFSGSHGWGYDGVDLFAPHRAYGGPDGFKRLVDACHAAGLGVLLDVVYNHLGPSGNYLAEFGPYFKAGRRTNWGDAVNLDGPGSDPVRRFVLDNARMWLEDYHCDGLRLDAVHALEDVSARHILEELAVEVEALQAHLGRCLVLVAESDRNDPRLVRNRDAGGYGLDACWADEWHHALHALLTGERDGYYEDFGSLAQLAKALKQGWVYDGQWSRHRQRRHGASPAGLAGSRLVVFTQNHDQVGNRATGTRLGELTSLGRLKIAASLLLTGPFTPLIFQGEEWGASTPFQYFTDHPDPELGRAVSQGRRREFAHFGWDPATVPDPQARATFERSKLDWRELARPPHAGMLQFHRELLRLRRALPALSDPAVERVRVRFDERAQWLWVRRGPVHVVANFAASRLRLQLPAGCGVLLASEDEVELSGTQLSLPAESVAIVASRDSLQGERHFGARGLGPERGWTHASE